MSTDSDPILPDEPHLAEPAEDEEPVYAAGLEEPPEGEPPPHRRPAAPSWRQGPPHPGFWWAVLWCVVMVIISQIIVPIPVAIIVIIVKVIQLGWHDEFTTWLQGA